MEVERTTLADELRRIAKELDRAGSTGSGYCASKCDTDMIRAAAKQLEIAATPDPDQHHANEIRRIMAADRPGGGS